jgi:hypothetical protein
MTKTALRLSLITAFTAVCFFSSVSSFGAVRLQASGTGPAPKTIAGKTVAKAPPSSQDITDAKAKGLVWANLSTHVYHKDDSSLYGTTKRGKFMTEEDAKKAGFRAANDAGASKKHQTARAGQK